MSNKWIEDFWQIYMETHKMIRIDSEWITRNPSNRDGSKNSKWPRLDPPVKEATRRLTRRWYLVAVGTLGAVGSRRAVREEVRLEGVAHPAPVLQHVVRHAHHAAQHRRGAKAGARARGREREGGRGRGRGPSPLRRRRADGLLQDYVAVVECLETDRS